MRKRGANDQFRNDSLRGVPLRDRTNRIRIPGVVKS